MHHLKKMYNESPYYFLTPSHMLRYRKLLFVHTHDAQMLQLLRAHAEDVSMDKEKHICVISINKLYAYNILS